MWHIYPTSFRTSSLYFSEYGPRATENTQKGSLWSSPTTANNLTQPPMSINRSVEALFRLPHYHNGVTLYGFPAVASLGGIFNVLSLAAILNSDMRQTSGGLYLSVLTCVDIVCLILSLAENWAILVMGTQFPHNLPLCHWKMFNFHFAICLKSICILCVTTDRFLAIYLPLRAKVLITRRRGIFVLLSVTIMLLGLHLPLLWALDNQCGAKHHMSGYLARTLDV